MHVPLSELVDSLCNVTHLVEREHRSLGELFIQILDYAARKSVPLLLIENIDAACEFRRKLDTDSSRSWTVIPRQAGH